MKLMKKNQNIKKYPSKERKFTEFDVVILCEPNNEVVKFFSKIFPKIINNFKYKFINKYGLCRREEIYFPKNFINDFFPEIIDKMRNIDILILAYTTSNKSSFDLLKRFYYIFYNKLEEKDKPKNIIIIELNSKTKGEENNDNTYLNKNNFERLKSLFNCHFYNNFDNEENLNEILKRCVENLKYLYNFKDDYNYFKYIELEKEININISIYGKKELQNLFINIILESKCNFEYKKLNENKYETKYDITINGNKFYFKLTLELMNIDYYQYDSICNIFLYDINDIKTYEAIKKIIREIIITSDSNSKKIFNLFSFNSSSNITSEGENIYNVKKGKILSDEIGANFTFIDTINNKNLSEEMKIKFDEILEEVINCVNINKFITENKKEEINERKYEFYDIEKYDSPLLYINEINNKIKNYYKENTNFLNNICPKCYNYLDIRINYISNIIILYCSNCKTEPRGVNINQFYQFNQKKNNLIHCNKCHNILQYDLKSKKLFCRCEKSQKSLKHNSKDSSNCFIPCILKNNFCDTHNKFYKYYMKYSKSGLCENCKMKINSKNYFIEQYNDNKINKLINQKKLELNEEKNFLDSLQDKLNECINYLLVKFEKLIKNKLKFHYLKSELINSLEIIKNNHTIISNIESLEFDTGKNFTYNNDDSIDNRIKSIFDYLKCDSDINNLYFLSPNNSVNDFRSYKNLINKEKTKITDICGINNNKLICVSYDDGQAKIYDLNIEEKNTYPKCIIKEFLPNQGVNSIYVSNNNNILKYNNYNKNEIIFLNGYEEIKFIQMNDNYDSYDVLYNIKDEDTNISKSIEIDFNTILILTNFSELKLIILNTGEDNKIKSEFKDITNLIIHSDEIPKSLNIISENIISLTFSRYKDNNFEVVETNNKSDNNNINDLSLTNELTIKIKDIPDLNISKINVLKDNGIKEENNIEDNYIKILYLYKDNYKSNEEDNLLSSENNINVLKIKKEFTFDKNFSLLGCISEENNLLLLNYSEKTNNKLENLFYIFDFNNCQFINAFKFHCTWAEPILFTKFNYNNICDKNGFVLCDKDLNYIQFFYDKNYINQIYYINNSKLKEKPEQNASKIIALDKKIIFLCSNNEYFIINIIRN